MSVSDSDMVRHEVAHSIGALIAGATSVEIVLKVGYAEAIPRWPGGSPSEEQFLTALLAGRAHVVPGMDTSLDDRQIDDADPALVARLEEEIMEEVRDRLECVGPAEINAMVATIREMGAIELKPMRSH